MSRPACPLLIGRQAPPPLQPRPSWLDRARHKSHSSLPATASVVIKHSFAVGQVRRVATLLASALVHASPSPEEAPVTTTSFLVPILRPPSTCRLVWIEMAQQTPHRDSVAWRSVARRGVACNYIAWRAGHNVVWRGMAWHGVAWRNVAGVVKGVVTFGSSAVVFG